MEITFNEKEREFFMELIDNLEKNKSLNEQQARGLRYRLAKL